MAETHSFIRDNGQEVKSHGTAAFPCATYFNNGEIMHVPWHWHEEFELSFLEQGQGVYYGGQQRFLLEPGDGIFFNSGTLHSEENPANQRCMKKDIVFHGRIVYGSYDSAIWNKYIQPVTACPGMSAVVFRRNTGWHREILGYMRDVYNACVGCCDGYEFDVKELLVKIFKVLYINSRDILSEEIRHSCRETDRVKQMLNYIHMNYRENVTVAQIAANANICERECLRCFKEFIRMSPIQYLIHYRINQACRMLRDGEANITEISNACGFESPSYFSKTFKRVTGCTPRQYR